MKLETSKYNISPWSLKSLQRDKEGHKRVTNHVCHIYEQTDDSYILILIIGGWSNTHTAWMSGLVYVMETV